MTAQEAVKRSEKSQWLKVWQVDDTWFYVESEDGKIAYKCCISDQGDFCNCGDFAQKGKADPHFKCKHLLAVMNSVPRDEVMEAQILEKRRARLDERFVKQVDGKDFALYAGLLDLAHQKHITSIEVDLLQFPTKENEHTAICRATAKTANGGIFIDVGDANPVNCNSKVAKHIIRMASTRAKARCLRDLTNIGMACLEELGDFSEVIGAENEAGKAMPPRKDNVKKFSPKQAPAQAAQAENDEGRKQENDDSISLGTGDYAVPYQNILAEMLFVRLPQTMRNLIMSEPLALRQKIFSRIARLDITARQKMTLYGYCQNISKPQQLMDAMVKMMQVSARMSLSSETKRTLKDYLNALTSHIKKVSQVYREWFLDRDLEIIRRLHEQGHWLKAKFSYAKELAKTFTHLATLEFYPTKDYLDVCKGTISGDCVTEILGEDHLREPRYFSIRMFIDRQWIGNIYMLDFTDERGILLIDRIQIPRNLKILYHRFFDHLKESFEELFADVPYKTIILPMTVSNHKTLQNVFNVYRKNLPAVILDFSSTGVKQFESVNTRQKYFVLTGKESAA